MDKKRYYQDKTVADRYDDVRFGGGSGKLAHAIELSAIKQAFSPDEKILEVACGTGRLLKALKQEGWNVCGLEQSEAMLEAGGLGSSSFIIKGDAFHSPVQNELFDGVYCFRFTNHYADLSSLFAEFSRILKKGGHALFDVMQWSPLVFGSRALGGRNYCPSENQIRLWLKQNNFSIENIRPLFLISPYLLGRMPLAAARIALSIQPLLPHALNAVTLWHVRKKD